MGKRFSPSVVISCLALFFSLTGAGFAARRVRTPIRHAARAYIASPWSSHLHVGRCRTLRVFEYQCAVAFDDTDSVDLNGEITVAHFNGVVFMRRAPRGLRCSFDPMVFAWERC